MKKFPILLAMLLFVLVANAQDEFGKISFNKAVNISGKQRMLSQKMSKAYLYLLENPTNIKAKTELETSKVIFEKHNEILSKYAVSKETSKKIDEVNDIWSKLSETFTSTPNEAGAKKIITTNTLLLRKADEVVKSIILDAETSVQSESVDAIEQTVELKNIINISGKQRMLAQRLALYYFANTASLKNDLVENNLVGAYTSFDNAITDLLISDFNNDQIEQVLGEAMKDWNEFKSHKEDFLNHKMSSQEVYSRTNNLTKVFNKLTILYEKVKM